MSAPHSCEWCRDPFRGVFIRLRAQGVLPIVIARHYGVPPTSVVGAVAIARQRGCLPPRACRYCGAPIQGRGWVCKDKTSTCAKRGAVESTRRHRARKEEAGGAQLSRFRPEPEGINWPSLPLNFHELRKEKGVKRRADAKRSRSLAAVMFSHPAAPVAAPRRRFVLPPPACLPICGLPHGMVAP